MSLLSQTQSRNLSIDQVGTSPKQAVLFAAEERGRAINLDWL